MKVDDIEIFAGKPDFEFEPIRQIEAKCEASHAFSSAPSMEEVNVRLRALAAKVGANAIVDVDYDSGISLTSWRALTGRGLAVKRVSDERQCPACAETIKKAAIKCRYCGEILADSSQGSVAPGSTFDLSDDPTIGRPSYQAKIAPSAMTSEPLKSSDAMPAWVWVLVGGLVFVFIVLSMGGT